MHLCVAEVELVSPVASIGPPSHYLLLTQASKFTRLLPSPNRCSSTQPGTRRGTGTGSPPAAEGDNGSKKGAGKGEGGVGGAGLRGGAGDGWEGSVLECDGGKQSGEGEGEIEKAASSGSARVGGAGRMKAGSSASASASRLVTEVLPMDLANVGPVIQKIDFDPISRHVYMFALIGPQAAIMHIHIEGTQVTHPFPLSPSPFTSFWPSH